MEKKGSFIMYLDYEEHFSFLSDKEIGILMHGIFQYVRSGEIPNFKKNKALNMAFSFMKTNIDIDNQKYQKKCEKNKRIADERWERERKKKEQQQFNGCHLGSLFKNDSCFKCQKKYICNLPESSDFKLSHPNHKSFIDWNTEKEELYKAWCEDREKRGESIDIDDFLNYDWMEDSDFSNN